MEVSEIEIQWAIMFAKQETKVLSFSMEDLLKIKEYLSATDQTPEDLIRR